MLQEGTIQKVDIKDFPSVFIQSDLTEKTFRKNSSNINLLSPFDNSIIHRDRVKQFFDFDYKIECYTPKEKRQFGYFCLPILFGDTFIGRVECKAHRKEKQLEIIHLHIENENIDKDKRYSSSTTTNIKSDDVNANVGSSSDSIKKSFADAEWVKSISGVTALDLTDKTVADACIEWFGMQCKAKGKTFDTDENARWYFCNLLQQGRKTREAFDEYYKQYKYDEMVRKTAMECCEDDYYDYKENGRRYDICHQIIPPDAPRQIDPNTTWSWIKLKFIPIDEFKGKPEMVARSKYYEEYRRTHNKQ